MCRDNAGVASHRLNDDGRNLALVLIDQQLYRVDIVVGGVEGIERSTFGYAGAVRSAEGEGTGTRLDEEAVAVAVVATFKFNYLSRPV